MIKLYCSTLLASGVLAGSALLATAAAPQSQGSAPAQKSAAPAKASPAGSKAGGVAAFPAKPAEGRGATSTLMIPASPAKAPDAQGFIPRWLVLEPIPVSSDLTENVVRTEVKKEYFPNQLTIFPKDGEKVTVNSAGLTRVELLPFKVLAYRHVRQHSTATQQLVYRNGNSSRRLVLDGIKRGRFIGVVSFEDGDFTGADNLYYNRCRGGRRQRQTKHITLFRNRHAPRPLTCRVESRPKVRQRSAECSAVIALVPQTSKL